MSIPSVHIHLADKEINPAYEVLSVDVCVEMNKVSWAEIVLIDGDAANRKFAVSESGDFDLGKLVKIGISYLNKPGSLNTVFEGIITRQSVQMDGSGQLLTIECQHASFLLTRTRRNATFTKQSDLDLFQEVLKHYGKAIKLDTSSFGAKKGPVHPLLIQYNATDWDFILSRCEANGWLVVPDGKRLKFMPGPAKAAAKKAATMDFNINEIYSIEVMADGHEQYASVDAYSYDYKALAAAKPVNAKGAVLSPGSLKPDGLPNISNRKHMLRSGVDLLPAEVDAWAKGRIQRSRLAFIRGHFEVKGDSQIMPGQNCKIIGIGSRFNGPAMITGVRHRVGISGWSTDIQIGLSPEPYHQGKTLQDAPAAGLVPGVTGLQLGKVEEFKADEDGKYRVLVKLASMDGAKDPIWARYLVPDAGAGKDKARGMLFWPEQGDEVVVGFLNDDPRAAVVIGSLFNGTNTPLYPPSKTNPKKGIVTKAGSTLEFDDEKKTIQLSTTKLSMLFDEEKKTITIKDADGGASFSLGEKGIEMSFKENKFSITQDGIEMVGAGNKLVMSNAGVEVKSKAELKLGGESGAKITGGPKVEITGGQIELK